MELSLMEICFGVDGNIILLTLLLLTITLYTGGLKSSKTVQEKLKRSFLLKSQGIQVLCSYSEND